MGKVCTPRRILSALSNASVISPVEDLNKSNSARRVKMCSELLEKVKRNVLETEDCDSKFNVADYKELMEALRLKVLFINCIFIKKSSFH